MGGTITGWVYVMTNESFPDLVKVGFTTRIPEDRAGDLDNTGVPTPFEVATAFLFSGKVLRIEQEAHRILAYCRERDGREFFRCSALDAAAAIEKAATNLGEQILHIKPVLLTPEQKRLQEQRQLEKQRQLKKQRRLEKRRREQQLRLEEERGLDEERKLVEQERQKRKESIRNGWLCFGTGLITLPLGFLSGCLLFFHWP